MLESGRLFMFMTAPEAVPTDTGSGSASDTVHV